MDQKIIEKPLFFLGFSNILKKSLEAFWNALADPLGTPWGGLGGALGGPGAALGGFGDALEGLGNVLGGLSGKTCLGRPWESLERSPRIHVRAAPLRSLSPILL